MTNLPTDTDIVFLANRDKVFGKVLSIEPSKATVEAKQTKLDIPLERVTQIRFAKAASETNIFPGDVRASASRRTRLIARVPTRIAPSSAT